MYDRESFTARANLAMQLAKQEAMRWGHQFIGTEFLLLGILKEGGGTAVQVLESLGIQPRDVRLKVEKISKPISGDGILLGNMPFTPAAKLAIREAAAESRSLGEARVGTDHLLLGLARHPSSGSAIALLSLGAGYMEIHTAIMGTMPGEIKERIAIPHFELIARLEQRVAAMEEELLSRGILPYPCDETDPQPIVVGE
jgi:ATP-dependent Clp protease ATP-binding subunit ClpC